MCKLIINHNHRETLTLLGICKIDPQIMRFYCIKHQLCTHVERRSNSVQNVVKSYQIQD